MRLPRTLTLILTLMLPVAIPFRGYAAVAQCGGSASVALQIGHAAHCAHGTGSNAGTAHPAGCSDGGFGPIERTTQDRIGKEVRWARTPDERAKSERQIAQILERPLSVDDAVQVALLGNGALQASFEELGMSEADPVQSGRLPNPGRHAAAGGVYDIEETLSVNVIALLTMPYLHRAQQQRFRETQGAVTLDIVELAARTREAYYTAVAAVESVRYREQVMAASEAGAELGRRMRAAGNWNRRCGYASSAHAPQRRISSLRYSEPLRRCRCAICR